MLKLGLALSLMLSLAGSWTGSRAAAAQPNAVQSVDYFTLYAGAALIRIVLAQPLAQPPSGFRTLYPAARVVLELPDTTVAPGRKTIALERGIARSIHLLRHGSGTRLVIELVAPATYETAVEGTTLLVTLRRTPSAPARDRWERFGAAPRNLIRNLRFERGARGEGRVVVSADPAAAIDVRQQGRRLIVSFLDSGIDPASKLRLDVLDFATPIDAIEARGTGRDALVVIETRGAFDYSARQSDAEFILTVQSRQSTQ